MRTLGALCWEQVGPVIDFSATEYELLREIEYFLSTADSQTTHPSLKSRVVRVPGDDGDPDVAGELEEVLGGRHRAPEVLAVNSKLSQAAENIIKYHYLKSFNIIP